MVAIPLVPNSFKQLETTHGRVSDSSIVFWLAGSVDALLPSLLLSAGDSHASTSVSGACELKMAAKHLRQAMWTSLLEWLLIFITSVITCVNLTTHWKDEIEKKTFPLGL